MSLTFKVADSLLYFAKARSKGKELTMERLNCYCKDRLDSVQLCETQVIPLADRLSFAKGKNDAN